MVNYDDISAFEQDCLRNWQSHVRSVDQLLLPTLRRIQDLVVFFKASNELKAHIAEKIVRESCSQVGALVDSGDVRWFLHNFARDFEGRGIFHGRRVRPLKAALLLAAHHGSPLVAPGASDCEHIRAGAGAVAATYLLPQLEFLFRVKGRYLKEDGTVKRTIPRQLLANTGLPPKAKRVNKIEQAFVLYIYRNITPLGRRLGKLASVVHITDRLRRVRHPALHGEMADPMVEVSFCALLIAMFWYAEPP